MCAIVRRPRKSLAAGAEIRVVTDGALVSVADNIGALALTKLTIAMDANVFLNGSTLSTDELLV